MTGDAPLNSDEELLWRSLLQLMIWLPRALDEDLIRATGMPLTEYRVLMHLSESPGRQLRMSELASATALSASRITRIVDDLQRQGLVNKDRHVGDARGNTAVLTSIGLARLKDAYPAHLVSARRHIVDRIDTVEVGILGVALRRIATAGDHFITLHPVGRAETQADR